jgi:ligand-binding SRPBCC domain-containing protein
MPSFVRETVIEAPVERVFAFHERDDALARLSPPVPPLRVIRRTGGLMPGAEVDLRVGPVRWLARHTRYDPPRLFVDEQVRGPFASWVHRHEFADAAGAPG